MKLFKFLAFAGLVASTSEASNDLHTLDATTDLSYRTKRQATDYIELTGTENPDELMDILYALSDGQEDELERAIMQLMGVDRISSELQVRKFRQLKIAVLYLQAEKKFGRYCYYGCYCLPEGSHNIAAGGYGKPLDDIDRSCQEFKSCYKCLLDEYDDGNCKGEDMSYRMQLTTDANGNKDIICKNKKNSCRYNVCQCDVQLAKSLAQFEATWDESLHSVRGGFNRTDSCHKGQGGHPFEECCGDTTTFPFNQPRKTNQCCDGYEAKPAGEC